MGMVRTIPNKLNVVFIIQLVISMNWPMACVIITIAICLAAVMIVSMIANYKPPRDPKEPEKPMMA